MLEQQVLDAVELGIVPVLVLPSPSERQRIRQEAGISINALARVMDVSRFTIRNWEHSVYEPSHRAELRYRRAIAAMQTAQLRSKTSTQSQTVGTQ